MWLCHFESHHYISPSSLARITVVSNFVTFICYIQQDLLHKSMKPVFWEITKLQKEMQLAQLSFFPWEA